WRGGRGPLFLLCGGCDRLFRPGRLRPAGIVGPPSIIGPAGFVWPTGVVVARLLLGARHAILGTGPVAGLLWRCRAGSRLLAAPGPAGCPPSAAARTLAAPAALALGAGPATASAAAPAALAGIGEVLLGRRL